MRLWEITDEISMLYMDDDTEYIANMREVVVDGKKYRKSQWYKDMFILEYETGTIKVPGDSDSVLKYIFGSDYALPRKFDGQHDYPFYGEQKQWLETHL